MNIYFHCNLDAAKPDVNRLNALRHEGICWNGMSVPRKGESIVFPFQKNGVVYSFELEVVDVNYNYFDQRIIVELHLPAVHKSIALWEPWFKAFRYGC